MKHDKGPWKVRLGRIFRQGIGDKGDAFNTTVQIRGANASLIESAPELLESLVNLVERDLIKDTNGDAFQEVLEAINKARGGT